MNSDKLNELHIPAEDRRRPQRPLWAIFLAVIVISIAALYFAWPRASDALRVKGGKDSGTNLAAASVSTAAEKAAAPATNAAAPDDVVLTVSGYIINRERIELSPRFMGTVTWIGV